MRHLGHREAVLRSYGEGPDGPAWSGPRVAGASPTGSGRTLGPRDALLPEIARAKATARRLSEVIDGFLAIPPPVRSRSVPSHSSFATPCWTLTSGPPAAPTADGEQGIGAAQGYTRHLGRRFSEGLVRRPLRADAARCLVTRRAAKSAP